MPDFLNKVAAYIVHRGKLLVFRHVDFPEAGYQVPGGSLEAGEDPREGVLREAQEETGLERLLVKARLGVQSRELHSRDQALLLTRHFFYVAAGGSPPDRWVHYEMTPSDGTPGPIAFAFFWAPVHEVPPLTDDMDAFLPDLLDIL